VTDRTGKAYSGVVFRKKTKSHNREEKKRHSSEACKRNGRRKGEYSGPKRWFSCAKGRERKSSIENLEKGRKKKKGQFKEESSKTAQQNPLF